MLSGFVTSTSPVLNHPIKVDGPSSKVSPMILVSQGFLYSFLSLSLSHNLSSSSLSKKVRGLLFSDSYLNIINIFDEYVKLNQL